MLTKIQKRRNQIKREKNNARRKEISLRQRKEKQWRESAKGKEILGIRAKEEMAKFHKEIAANEGNPLDKLPPAPGDE